jgi:hypothetical protein
MRPEGSHTLKIDLGCNPNLITLSLQINPDAPLYLVRLLGGFVMPNLQQVTLYLSEYPEWYDWLEIDRVLNGQASVCLVEIVLDADPTPSPTFIEYSPLLWSRGILKVTYLPHYRWPVGLSTFE